MLVGHGSVCLPQLFDEADVVNDQTGVAHGQNDYVQVEVAKQRVGPAGLLGQRVQQENRKTPVERRFAADEADNLQQVGNGGHAGQHKGQEWPPELYADVSRSDRFGQPEHQGPDQKPQGEVPCSSEAFSGFCDHEPGGFLCDQANTSAVPSTAALRSLSDTSSSPAAGHSMPMAGSSQTTARSLAGA